MSELGNKIYKCFAVGHLDFSFLAKHTEEDYESIINKLKDGKYRIDFVDGLVYEDKKLIASLYIYPDHTIITCDHKFDRVGYEDIKGGLQ